jgi:ubiquinone/menaquinone biosynthesis C-methylase UbiE
MPRFGKNFAMPLHVTATYIDEYRYRASEADPIAMSGRRSQAHLELRNQAAFAALSPVSGESVLDVGCGNGSFLCLAASAGSQCIGLVPTREEIARLGEINAGLSDLTFIQGMAQALPLPDSKFDKLCCNGVLLTLPSHDDLMAALREFRRVLKTGGLAFVGELPTRDEDSGRPLPPSVPRWIWRQFRNGGVRNGGIPRALSATLSVFRAITKTGPSLAILAHGNHLFISSEEFCKLATEASWEIIMFGPTAEIDGEGREVVSESRIDYLMRAVPTRE